MTEKRKGEIARALRELAPLIVAIGLLHLTWAISSHAEETDTLPSRITFQEDVLFDTVNDTLDTEPDRKPSTHLQMLLIVSAGGEGAVDAFGRSFRVAMENALQEMAFRVMESSGKESFTRDPEELGTIGRDHSADLILSAYCEGSRTDNFGSFAKLKTTVEVRLTAGYTGRSIAEQTFEITAERQVDEDAAAVVAAESVARDAANYMKRFLEDENLGLVVRRVMVSGVTERKQTGLILSSLALKPSVIRVDILASEAGVESGTVAYEVEMEAAGRQDLAFFLESLGSVQLRVTAETPAWVEADIVSEAKSDPSLLEERSE